ncbi:nuclear transport factor 2 family protein [Desulfobulbus sp. AH-315-M07]|nr:nuclear transport factor 2 family protein [Desulfobulbus sp. AH-315-M07]
MAAPCDQAALPAVAIDRPASVSAGWADEKTVDRLLSAWHAAAARADEEAYFGYFADDAVFLGTDETERWKRDAFREYAHPHFAKGKAWSFQATRRAIAFSGDGTIAWFDEDLTTPNLGPARGSGVLVKRGGDWWIKHYNLTITVPNERFKEVKVLLETPKPPPAKPPSPETVSPELASPESQVPPSKPNPVDRGF